MVVMKHVVFFVLLVAVTIAKPPDNAKETEKSLQYDSFNVNKAKSPVESILTKRRPIIIKSKIKKPKTKKRFIGGNPKPKSQLEQDEKKTALTFALDSDDNLSSVISMIIKLLEEEELADLNLKKSIVKDAPNPKTNTKAISENRKPSKEIPETTLDSERNIILPKLSISEQHENFTSNNDATVIELSSQTTSKPTQPFNSNLNFSTTSPSNFILETSVSFEPSFDNNSILPKGSEQNKETSANSSTNDASNNDEESSKDFSNDTDDDTKHYCPEGFKDEDKLDIEDSIVDLDKLILLSEISSKSPVEFLEDKMTSIPAFHAETKPSSEIQRETSSIFPTESYSETKPDIKIESTTIESLNIDARLSETTTVSSIIFTDIDEVIIPEGPTDMPHQEIFTTEKQNEATTFVTFSHNTDYYNDVTTEQDLSGLLTTLEPQNDEIIQTTLVNNEFVNEFVTTIPTVTDQNKLDFNTMVESTTVTEQPDTTLTVSQPSSVNSLLTPRDEVLDKVNLQIKPLPAETFTEPSPYPITPNTELRLFENQTFVTDEINDKLKDALKPSTASATTETAAASTEATSTSQITKIISPSSSLLSLDINKSQEKYVKQENIVRGQTSAEKPTKPQSRLITFTLYDRKEKYTSLKHFIDYLRTLKK